MDLAQNSLCQRRNPSLSAAVASVMEVAMLVLRGMAATAKDAKTPTGIHGYLAGKVMLPAAREIVIRPCSYRCRCNHGCTIITMLPGRARAGSASSSSWIDIIKTLGGSIPRIKETARAVGSVQSCLNLASPVSTSGKCGQT